MKEEKKGLFIPLNIQMFAEGDGETQEQPEPKTYSQEEMDKIIAERDKLKNANDALSRENAEHKRKEKAQLSDEEKKKQENEEKDKILEETKKELLSIKMSKELLVLGFEDSTVDEIIKSYTTLDGVEFAKSLSKNIKALIENVRKEEQDKFQKSSQTPPASTSGNDGIDPYVKKYVESKNNTNNTTKAREMYLKR